MIVEGLFSLGLGLLGLRKRRQQAEELRASFGGTLKEARAAEAWIAFVSWTFVIAGVAILLSEIVQLVFG